MGFMRLLALPLVLALLAPARSGEDKRPKVSVKATPAMAFSPARIIATAEITGGANDLEEFYCAATEWDWGDGTKSNNSADCEPYEAGKSEMRRHFAVDHVFRAAGEYRIQFRLRKKAKVVGAASTTVKVRPGVGDPGGLP